MLSVARSDLDSSNQHEVEDLMPPVRQINDHLTTRGLQRDKISVLHQNASAISEMNSKRTKRLSVQYLANFFDLHAIPVLVQTQTDCKVTRHD